jgi:hypothetical protein
VTIIVASGVVSSASSRIIGLAAGARLAEGSARRGRRMELGVKGGAWAAVDEPRVSSIHARLARATDWLLPYASRLGGGYFPDGVEQTVCRTLHEAARRQTLYRFAPPPPLRLAEHGRRAGAADEYYFRSPFVSHQRARNDAVMHHHHAGGGRRPLVILNPGAGLLARAVIACRLVASLRGAGLDVAVPIAPGSGSRGAREDRRRGWAHSVGSALSAVVQLVHDNVAVEAWARERGYRTVIACGLGIGGTVVAILAATTARFDAYVPMLAGAHLGRTWFPPRPPAHAVHRRALARDGVRHRDTLARLFDPIAPIRLPPPRACDRCTLVALRGDPVVLPGDVRDLARHWGTTPVWLPHARIELPFRTRQIAALVARRALAIVS